MPSAASQSLTSFALCAARLIPAADGRAPEFVQLLPLGDIETRDGRGPFRLDNPQAVIAASMAEAPLPIDENHSIDLAAPNGGASPACGWITELQARADGIWGRVEWTAVGEQLFANKAYKGISPRIICDAKGNVLALNRAALTNNHNLVKLATFHAAQDTRNQESNMDLAKLREALGLPADADEAAIVSAAAAARSASQTASTHAAAIAEIGQAVGAAKDADATAVLNAVRTAVDPAKMVPASAVAELQSQLTKLTLDTAREKAEAYVDGAIRAGKPGVKPLRDHYITRHMADPASVEKELGAMVSLHAARPAPKADVDDKGRAALDAGDERVIQLMGVDPEAYAKTKAALGRKEETL